MLVQHYSKMKDVLRGGGWGGAVGDEGGWRGESREAGQGSSGAGESEKSLRGNVQSGKKAHGGLEDFGKWKLKGRYKRGQ